MVDTEVFRLLNIAADCFSLMLVLVLMVGMSHRGATLKRRTLLMCMRLHFISVGGGLVTYLSFGNQGSLARVGLALGSFLGTISGILTGLGIMVYIYMDEYLNPKSGGSADALVKVVVIANGINLLLTVTNPFLHLCYSITPQNTFDWGPLGFMYDWLVLVQGVLMIPVVVHLRTQYDRRATVRMLICGVLIVVGIVIDIIQRNLVVMTVMVSFVLMLLGVGVQAKLEEDLIRARAEVAESKLRLLSGQIHPHFIFNSLSAIKALVVEDPPLAERTIQDFSDYLRSHLDVMSSLKLVPFEQELNHVRHYVSLEMADLARPLTVTYDLAVEDFMVPPLTVQPLVENAIRHGIRTREEGGTICVKTRQSGDTVTVMVCDDGRGVSSATPLQEERRSVGIYNVRERIERQCNGTLEVTSGPDGTVAVLTLPKGGGQ